MLSFSTLLTMAVVGTATPPAAPPAAPPAQHMIGLYNSNIAGSGLVYGQALGGGWGFHVSGIGWSQAGSPPFYDVGGALTKDITVQEWGSLYGFLGAGAGSIGTDVAPGIGVALGPLFAELGYSVFVDSAGKPGFVPAGGLGLGLHF